MKITKTRRKWWVLSRAVSFEGMDQGHEGAYSQILAVCKTIKEAKKLRDQNKNFKGASIDAAPQYMHQY